MSIRNLIATSAVAAALLVPFAATAAPKHQHEAGCALAGYDVTQVAPYRVEERVGRGTYHRLVGAKLFIPAQPGLTREWIGANVSRHLQQMQASSMPGCPLDVEQIKVSVSPGKTGYWVQIAGPNNASAKEILARAQHLVAR